MNSLKKAHTPYYITELSQVGNLSEVKEVRGN